MDHNLLARKSQNGSRASFGKLYECFAKRIYSYVYYRSYHRETAEDLTASIFLKALEKLHTFRPEDGGFQAWLYGIARNTLTDHYRQRAKAASMESGSTDVWDIADPENMELDVQNRDQWERLKPYLRGLTFDQREVILLRLWDDLPYREIAAITGKSEDACKMSYSRALAFLRQAMPLSLFIAFLLEKASST